MGSYALRGFLVRQLLDEQTASLETVVENALIIILRPPEWSAHSWRFLPEHHDSQSL